MVSRISEPSTVGRTNPCWKWFSASMCVSGVYTQHETREIPAFPNSHLSYQALEMTKNQQVSLGLWLTPIYKWSYIHSLKQKTVRAWKKGKNMEKISKKEHHLLQPSSIFRGELAVSFTGVIYMTPNKKKTSCTFIRELPQIYHTFALFDPPKN